MELEIGLMLSDLLADDDKAYELPKGVKEDIASLRQSVEERLLPGIRVIAEGPMDQLGEHARYWAREATGLLYDIEHAVDIFWVSISASTGAHPPGGLKALIGKINLKWATAKARRQLATNIKHLKQRTRDLDERPFGSDTDFATHPVELDEIHERYSRYATDFVPHAMPLPALFADPAGFVGIDHRRDELVQILSEEGSTSNRQLKMVSILGVPGVGKTTLANVVYGRVKNHFDCAAWISVGARTDIISTFESLLRQISQQDDHHQPVPSHPNLTSPKNFETRKLHEVRAALKDKRHARGGLWCIC